MFDILLSEADTERNPLYIQIYKQLRDHIQSGVISNGARLPSIRSLQMQLNISKTPIETAYQMLSAEGYILSRERSGYYAVRMETKRDPVPRPREQPMQQEPAAGQAASVPCLNKPNRIDFTPSAVDRDLFPLRMWKRLLGSAMENEAARIGQYGDLQGEESLRRELALYLRNSRGVICTPDQIVIGSGIAYSIGILLRLLEGVRVVAMEEPGFSTVREQFRLNRLQLIPMEISEGVFPIGKLEISGAHILYVTPSHQFPTGRVMPYSERERLLKWASRQDGYIIEDDYDGEFRYLGKPIPSLQGLDHDGRVIYIGTFSKAFTPALRMNYMVLPPALSKRLREMRHLLACPSRIEQWAMKDFIGQGHWYRHIRRMRNLYKKKHLCLLELIRTHFDRQVEVTGHSAGLHIQLTVKKEIPAEELTRRAEQHGVQVYDFKQMWMKYFPPVYPHIYLGFGGIRETEMETGILRLKEAWSDLWNNESRGGGSGQ